MTRHSGKSPDTGLTTAQERFVQAVASGKTQREAYREAYPAAARWKDWSVDAKASKLAADQRVRNRIDAVRAEVAAKVVDRIAVDRATTLEEIARIAFSDVGHLFNEAGQLRPLSELTPAERACIASFEVQTETAYKGDEPATVSVIKVKLWNKVESLEKLAKHLGLYEADNKQRGGALFEGLPRAVTLQVMAVIERLMDEHAGHDSGRPGEAASAGASSTTH